MSNKFLISVYECKANKWKIPPGFRRCEDPKNWYLLSKTAEEVKHPYYRLIWMPSTVLMDFYFDEYTYYKSQIKSTVKIERYVKLTQKALKFPITRNAITIEQLSDVKL